MFKKFKIGHNGAPVVIAEIEINHNAYGLIYQAIKSEAEIIKHQTYIAIEKMSVEVKNI